jgi:hypothetical protein
VIARVLEESAAWPRFCFWGKWLRTVAGEGVWRKRGDESAAYRGKWGEVYRDEQLMGMGVEKLGNWKRPRFYFSLSLDPFSSKGFGGG